MLLENGWLVDARRVPSPHHDCRPEDEKPTLLVVHKALLQIVGGDKLIIPFC